MDLFGTLPLAVLDWETRLPVMLETVIYFVIAFLFFGIAIVVCDKLVPFSIRKEIEEDHNVSLGIVIGSALIGLSMIVAAAMG